MRGDVCRCPIPSPIMNIHRKNTAGHKKHAPSVQLPLTRTLHPLCTSRRAVADVKVNRGTVSRNSSRYLLSSWHIVLAIDSHGVSTGHERALDATPGLYPLAPSSSVCRDSRRTAPSPSQTQASSPSPLGKGVTTIDPEPVSIRH